MFFFLFVCLFFKILFIYLTEGETASEREEEGEWERKKQASEQSREPDAGLDPRTLGSHQPKADA